MRTARILRGKFGLLPAELLADVRKMEATLRSQVVLINDFLELARLETVGYKLDREPLDLRTVVDATLEEAVPLLEAGKLHLNRHLGDGPSRSAVTSGGWCRWSRTCSATRSSSRPPAAS